MTHAMRIAELEAALSKTVEYLRTLPLVPATYHLASEVERVLNESATPTPFEAVRATPGGVVTIAARITRNRIEIKTGDVDRFANEIVQGHITRLYKSLKDGVILDAHPQGAESFYLFR